VCHPAPSRALVAGSLLFYLYYQLALQLGIGQGTGPGQALGAAKPAEVSRRLCPDQRQGSGGDSCGRTAAVVSCVYIFSRYR